MRRNDICLYVSPANRVELDAIIADRNSSSKLAWRAQIVLATADGLGTNAIMRLTRKSKPCVWRWQERYVGEGIEGLKRDKTRPSRIPPLSTATKVAVLKKTTTEKPAGGTHWSARDLAKVVGLSHRSIQRIWSDHAATASVASASGCRECGALGGNGYVASDPRENRRHAGAARSTQGGGVDQYSAQAAAHGE